MNEIQQVSLSSLARGAALFEGDGGEWKLEAVGRIRDWLRNELPEGIAILA